MGGRTPYRCEEGNYLADGSVEAHFEYDTWQEFYEFATETDFADEDYNLIYRWDWVKPNPEDYEPGEEYPSDKLMVFAIQQRKAFNVSYSIAVCEEDEPEIAAIWQPLLDRALNDL